jgi:hypothetical protein
MKTESASFSPYGPEWIRGPASIEGGEVRLDRKRVEKYRISETHDLLFSLASMDKGSPEDVKAFVRRYGLLWHGPDELGGELRESLRGWVRVGTELVETMKFSTDLADAERTGSIELLRDSSSLTLSRLYKEVLLPMKQKGNSLEDLVGAASEALARHLDEKLQGSRLGVRSAWRENMRPHYGKLILDYHPKDLVTAAYAELAMLLVERRELENCLGCGRRFLPKSGKQKYCERSCSERTRQRKRRRQQSAQNSAG